MDIDSDSLCWKLMVVASVCFYGPVVLRLCGTLYKKCLKKRVDLKKVSEDGKAWAIVTGATDGIGKAFAFGLAKRGLNIVLIGRSEDKLSKVKAEIINSYGEVKVLCVRVDFVKDEVAQYKQVIADAINNLRIDVLINNVGIVFGGMFDEISEEAEDNCIKCNIKSFSTLTRIVIPQMVCRKFGVIVNISSITAKLNASLLSLYSATKAYIARWSDILAEEYGADGIVVQTVTPGYVYTKMIPKRDEVPKIFMTTPETLSENCLESLGINQSLNGYWSHGILEYLLSIDFVIRFINARRVSDHLKNKKNQ